MTCFHIVCIEGLSGDEYIYNNKDYSEGVNIQSGTKSVSLFLLKESFVPLIKYILLTKFQKTIKSLPFNDLQSCRYSLFLCALSQSKL
jgi:hypothetical protein